MVIFQVSQVSTNLWLAYWTEANDPSNVNFYLIIYCVLSITFAFMAFFRVLFLVIRNITNSKALYNKIIKNLFMAPLTEFYERIPAGRILNRLSKDLASVDTEIPFNVGNTLAVIFKSIADLAFCIYASGVFSIPAVVVFLLLAYYLQQKFNNVNRELIRLGFFFIIQKVSQGAQFYHYLVKF